MLGQSPQTAKGETSTGRIVSASQRSEGKRTYEARHQLPCTGPYSSWIQGLHVSSGQPVTRVVMRWWHGCGAHSGSQGNVRSPWCRRTRCYGGRWSRHRLSTGTHPALHNNTHTLVNTANGASPTSRHACTHCRCESDAAGHVCRTRARGGGQSTQQSCGYPPCYP